MNSHIIRAMTRDGSARLIFAQTTDIVQTAHKIHNTSKTITAVLGRCLTAASLMGSLLKDADNSLTLQIKGDGPAGSIICVSDYCGNVKGYIENPDVELLPNVENKLDVGGAVGGGTLYVIKDMGLAEPYIGMTPIVSGEIAEDITEYFAASEQIPTICALGVRCATDNSCVAAGGFLLQLLPNPDENMIPQIENNIAQLDSLSSMLAKGENPLDIIAKIFKDIEYDLFDQIDIDYICGCTKDRYYKALISLGKDELQSMIDDNKPIETNCRFCNKSYTFSMDEIGEMLNHVGTKEG